MEARKHAVSDGVIRWAFLWEEVKPRQTSTCALFWRCAVLSPLKILFPVGVASFFIVGILWRPIFHPVIEAFFPGSLAPLRPMEPTSPEDIRMIVYVIAGAVALIGVVLIADKAGFFDWLHGFCYPVEIDGGFVKKGTCPSCPGRMVLSGDEWECIACHGRFVPAVEKGAPADAVARTDGAGQIPPARA